MSREREEKGSGLRGRGQVRPWEVDQEEGGPRGVQSNLKCYFGLSVKTTQGSQDTPGTRFRK